MRFKEFVLEGYLNTANPRVKNSNQKAEITSVYSELPLERTKKNINGFQVYLFHPEKTDREKLEVLLKNEKTGEFLGVLRLIDNPHNGGSYVFSDIDTDPSIHGSTAAIKMYAYVIKDLGYTVVSDDTQTKGALSVWKRLASYPGIVVYQWDLANDEYSAWSPSDHESAFVSSDDMEALNKEEQQLKDKLEDLLDAGKIDYAEYGKLLKKYMADLHNDADIMDTILDYRLVATRSRGLSR